MLSNMLGQTAPVTAVFLNGPHEGERRQIPKAWRMLEWVTLPAPLDDEVREFLPAETRESEILPYHIPGRRATVYERAVWKPGFESEGVPYIAFQRRTDP
ncbi:hypothetical protein GCM10022204_41730 [Microlunatus aurantiacus]|uniref:Uncharacterized protein n=1 Tax=Microlunatus aurantiacus TaxID=446786 RepID=A0ABP7ECZ8_9ACTN